MSERIKPTIEDLQQRVQKVEEAAQLYRTRLEETIKSEPLRSAGIIFVVGTVLGILLTAAVSKRR